MKYRVSALALLLVGFFVTAILLLTYSVFAVSASSPSDVQWTTDIQVNPDPVFTNTGHVNAGLAISPLNSNFVAAAYDAFGVFQGSGYAASMDGGRTWAGGLFQGTWGANLTPSGNGNVAISRDGIAYYTGYATDGSSNGYFVLTSTNGLSWGAAQPIVTYDSSSSRSQSNFVIDQRPGGVYAGSLYLFWIYSPPDDPAASHIVMRYSRDGGQTWSSDIDVSEEAHDQAIRPWATVAPDGSIYLAYTQEDESSVTAPPTLYLNHSTDGGATWGADVAITGAPITPVGGPDFKGRELVLLSSVDCGYVEVIHRPFIAVSPVNAAVVYAVWNDGRWDAAYDLCNSAGKHSDIAFSRSTDAGATWSESARLNDDPIGNGKDQYSPNIAVGRDGTIGVTWYDRRYTVDGYFFDRDYSQSTDGGLTWSINQRISDVSSDPTKYSNTKGASDLGSRQPLVFGPNYALPGWVDTRIAAAQGSRRADIFVDRGNVCTLAFTDMPPGSTFYANMRCLACKDILSGYACGGPGEPCDASGNPYFRPNNNVTRGQLAKIVSNAAGLTDPAGAQIFEDVPPADPFYDWVQRLASHGYMQGYPCGGPGEPCVDPGSRPYFRPYNNATRGQSSKIVGNTFFPSCNP